MGGSAGDDADAESGCEISQCAIALVVERMTVMGQLDSDPPPPEPVHQISQRHSCGFGAAGGECLAHMTFAASGQDVPVPAGRLRQRVEVIARFTLLAPGEVGGTQLTGQPPIPFGPAGQDEQMRAGWVGVLGPGDVGQRQLGAEDRRHAEFGGRLGEAHHSVEPVVVGQGDGTQLQPRGLGDQLLGAGGAVEKAVGRMGVQLGVVEFAGRRRSAPTGPRRRHCGGTERRSCRRPAVEHPLHLGPAGRPVVPSHSHTI